MKKIQTTKLKLSTQTIRTLDDKQLEHAAGAGRPPTQSCWHLTCTRP